MPIDIPTDRNTFPIRARFVKCFILLLASAWLPKIKQGTAPLLVDDAGTSISRLHNSFFQGFPKQAEALRPYRALQRGSMDVTGTG